MEISLKKSENAHFQYYASNGDVEIPICASSKLESGNEGFSPMQLLLVGVGGCMSIDVIMILRKQKQEIDNYSVKVSATRVDATPAIFKDIHIHIDISGEVQEEKLQKAIQLSEEKYCSVHHILGATADIKVTYTLS